MLHHVDHPLITAELTKLRDPGCPSHEFRQRLRRIASLMVPAVTADMERESIPCITPLEETIGSRLMRPIVLVAVLRAGLGFLDGFLDLIPEASVAHIGLARDEETLLPEEYFFKYPSLISDLEVIVLDPMLATGGSAVKAVTTLLNAGAKRIRYVSLLVAPEGVEVFHREYPEVPVFTAAVDRCLNHKGYIMPGLGDAGDRMFGTF